MEDINDILKKVSQKVFDVKYSSKISEGKWIHALSVVNNSEEYEKPIQKKTKDAIYYNNIRATQLTDNEFQSVSWHRRSKKFVASIDNFKFSMVSDEGISEPFDTVPPPVSRRDNHKIIFKSPTHTAVFIKSNGVFEFVLDFAECKISTGKDVISILDKFENLFGRNIEKIPRVESEVELKKTILVDQSNLSVLTQKRYAVSRIDVDRGEPGLLIFRAGSSYIHCISDTYIVNFPIPTNLVGFTYYGEFMKNSSMFIILDKQIDGDLSERFDEAISDYNTLFTDSLKSVINLGSYMSTGKIASDVMELIDVNGEIPLRFTSMFSEEILIWNNSIHRLSFGVENASLKTRDNMFVDNIQTEDNLQEFEGINVSFVLSNPHLRGNPEVNGILCDIKRAYFSNSSEEVDEIFKANQSPVSFNKLLERLVMEQEISPGPMWTFHPQNIIENTGLDSTSKSPDTALPSGNIKPTTLLESLRIRNKEQATYITNDSEGQIAGVLLERELEFIPKEKYELLDIIDTERCIPYDIIFSYGSIEKFDPIFLSNFLNKTSRKFVGYYIDTDYFKTEKDVNGRPLSERNENDFNTQPSGELQQTLAKQEFQFKIDRKTHLSWNDGELSINIKKAQPRVVATCKIYVLLGLLKDLGWEIIEQKRGFGYSSHPNITDGYCHFTMVKGDSPCSPEKVIWKEIPNTEIVLSSYDGEDWWKDCAILSLDKTFIYKPMGVEEAKFLIYDGKNFHRVIAKGEKNVEVFRLLRE
jgi:hypothetical protein